MNGKSQAESPKQPLSSTTKSVSGKRQRQQKMGPTTGKTEAVTGKWAHTDDVYSCVPYVCVCMHEYGAETGLGHKKHNLKRKTCIK